MTTDEPAVTCAIHGVPVDQYETGRGGYTVLCPRCLALRAAVLALPAVWELPWLDPSDRALRMVKGVHSVTPAIATSTDWMAEARAKTDAFLEVIEFARTKLNK